MCRVLTIKTTLLSAIRGWFLYDDCGVFHRRGASTVVCDEKVDGLSSVMSEGGDRLAINCRVRREGMWAIECRVR